MEGCRNFKRIKTSKSGGVFDVLSCHNTKETENCDSIKFNPPDNFKQKLSCLRSVAKENRKLY